MSDEWVESTLGEVAIEVNDKVDPRASPSTRYVGLEHLDSGAYVLSTFGDSQDVVSAKTRFQEGDVLFGKLRPYLQKSALAPFPGICSTDILVFRAREELTTPGFLALLLQDARAFKHAERTSAGTRMPRTSARAMKSLEVALPPPPEQRRIVDVISSIDAAIVEGEAYAATIRALRDSIIRTEYEADGTSVTLGSLCGDTGIQIGPFGSQLHQSDYTEGGVPVVMPANMKDGMIREEGIARIPESKAEELLRHRLLPGDILLPRRGDLSKRAFVENKHEGWLCGTGSARVRVSGVNPEAVYRAISAPSATRWLYENAVGTTMPNLNTTIVSNLPLRFPPDPSAPLSSLRALDEAISRAVELVSSLRGWRRSCLASLLSRTRVIPDSYDRLLEEAS